MGQSTARESEPSGTVWSEQFEQVECALVARVAQHPQIDQLVRAAACTRQDVVDAQLVCLATLEASPAIALIDSPFDRGVQRRSGSLG